MLNKQVLCDSNKQMARSVFRTSMGCLATVKEELPAPREALIKAGCAKCREGKKHLRVKKSSLKSVTLAVQQHKKEVPDGETKTPEKH